MSGEALRILIVEDQFLIAKQLELIATCAGHDVIGTADTMEAACGIAATTSLDIAFVDVSLADGTTGVEVATRLMADRAVHVVFTTANRRRLPRDFAGAVGVVEKPYTRSGLLLTLNYIAARIWGAVEPPAKPESLQLSPVYSARWRH